MDQEKKQENLACFYFSLIGIGYLFPFSAMSQPADYWQILFPSFNVLFYISAVFMYTNLALLTLLVFFTREPTTRSFIWRIYFGFIGQLIALLIVPSSYFLGFGEDENTVVILAATAFMALVTAFLDSSVIALSGCFSVKCQESLQLGVGLSTLIGCIYRIITKIAFPPSREGTVVSSLIYFYSGSMTIIGCIICFFFLLRMPLAQKKLQLSSSPFLVDGQLHDETGSARPLLEDKISSVDINSGKFETQVLSSSSNLLELSSTEELVDFSKYEAFKKSFLNGASVTFLFLTTLAVWPALITEIPTYNFPSLDKGAWWSLILLSLFASMDVIGRYTVSYRFGVRKETIWIPVTLRLLFIPLIIMCVKGIFFRHDAWSILLVCILGWSNGWCGSLTILLMNECGDTGLEKRYIGILASFYLNGGLVIGSTLGLIVENFMISH